MLVFCKLYRFPQLQNEKKDRTEGQIRMKICHSLWRSGKVAMNKEIKLNRKGWH